MPSNNENLEAERDLCDQLAYTLTLQTCPEKSSDWPYGHTRQEVKSRRKPSSPDSPSMLFLCTALGKEGKKHKKKWRVVPWAESRTNSPQS